MALGSPTGRPCDVYREQLQYNSGSYGGNDSDDFRFNSGIAGVPTRTGHNIDTTAYATMPTSDSWVVMLRQRQTQV